MKLEAKARLLATASEEQIKEWLIYASHSLSRMFPGGSLPSNTHQLFDTQHSPNLTQIAQKVVRTLFHILKLGEAVKEGLDAGSSAAVLRAAQKDLNAKSMDYVFDYVSALEPSATERGQALTHFVAGDAAHDLRKNWSAVLKMVHAAA